MAKVILVTLFFIFPVFTSVGQVFNFKNFFVNDGLSQSQVTAIDHDAYGNVWLATYGGGVNRFDGHVFETFGISDGLPHNQVNDIYVDVENRVWCAMQSGGVGLIDNAKVQVFRFKGDNVEAVTAIDAWNGGVVAGTNSGHVLFVNSFGETSVFDAFPHRGISDVVAYDTIAFIAVKDSGVFQYQHGLFQLVTSLNNVDALHYAQDFLFLAVGNVLYKYDLLTETLQKEIEVRAGIRNIEYDIKTKTVYLALYGNGVGRYINGNVSYINENNGLASDYCISIHIDNFGLLWIGTDGAGLSRFSGFQFVHYTFNDQYDGNPVMSIYKESDSEMWFATYGHGIIQKKGIQYNRFDQSANLPSNTYYSIEKHGVNTLWFASKNHGLVSMNMKTHAIEHFHKGNSPLSNNLLYLKQDVHGDLYVTSSDKGLFIHHNNQWIELGVKHGLPDNHINHIVFDIDNNLWLATATSGVIRISAQELQRFIQNPIHIIDFEVFKLKKNVYQVITLAIDHNGLVWGGLFGGGLVSVSDGKLERVSINSKMESQNIYGMLYESDHSALWIGTDKGLAQISLDANSNPFSIESLSAEEGFKGVECNRNSLSYDYDSESLWIGVVIGVTRYFPDGYTLTNISPSVKIENVSFRGQRIDFRTYRAYDEIDWDDAPQIPFDSNGVRIDFKAIDQLQPESLQYQYVMMGINEDWHQLTGISHAEYNFLPSGRYVFKLRAINGQGVWSDFPVHVPFVVETPYWQTNLFYLGLILSFLIFMTLYMYMRQRSLTNRNRRLSDAVFERTEALNNEKIVVEQHREELRSQAEYLEQVNRELEKLSLVASKTDNAVLIADKDGQWEWANEGFVKMFGFTLQEFITVRGASILEASSSPKIKHIVEEVVYLKKSVTYTSKVPPKIGDDIWVQSTLTPIFDRNDELKRFIVIDTDITHIKRINNELRKLSLIASKTDNSVIMMSRDGRIEWVNDAFHRFYDMSLEEFKTLYQKTIFDLHTGVKGVFELEEIISSRMSKSFISSFVTRKGVQKWIQSNVTPVAGMGNEGDQLIAIETDITRLKLVEQEMKIQRKKSDELLLNILPAETAEELKSQGQAQPRYYDSATVLFCDFKNFTAYCEQLSPHHLVSDLREYFDVFDDIVGKYYVEKIKTIGDAYMCAGGLPIRNRSHAFDVLLTALEIQKKTLEINQKKLSEGRQPWEMRMGIHTGDLVAGVVGKIKFAYDIWGDTVNIASRMESACEVGRINISGDTYNVVKDFFSCTYRGKIEAKNIGKIDMYFVDGLKPEFSVNGNALVPNSKFQNYVGSL